MGSRNYYVETTSGETFCGVFGSPPKAAYLYHIEAFPPEYRRATDDEVRAFIACRRELWALVEKHYESIGRSVTRRLRCFEYLEEIQTDVIIPAIIRCAELYESDEGTFSSYAWKACYRGVIDWLRKRGRMYFVELPEETLVAEISFEHIQRDSVIELMKGLTVSDRKVLRLRFWGGLTVREMADELGISTGTAHSRLNTAIQNAKNYAIKIGLVA